MKNKYALVFVKEWSEQWFSRQLMFTQAMPYKIKELWRKISNLGDKIKAAQFSVIKSCLQGNFAKTRSRHIFCKNKPLINCKLNTPQFFLHTPLVSSSQQLLLPIVSRKKIRCDNTQTNSKYKNTWCTIKTTNLTSLLGTLNSVQSSLHTFEKIRTQTPIVRIESWTVTFQTDLKAINPLRQTTNFITCSLFSIWQNLLFKL
jgi:hypothetical protein